MPVSIADLAQLGVATVYEAAGRRGLLDGPFAPVACDSRAAGPARTVLCGQDDNLGVHRALELTGAGEVLVVTMPEPAPVGLVGDILALQARVRGLAALLVDAAIRDHAELVALGLPVWSRWTCARGAAKDVPGRLDVPVTVGGQRICPGDAVVLDRDGVVVVARADLKDVTSAAQQRAHAEAQLRQRIGAGDVTLDLLHLRTKAAR
jgi:4-hydroxy-4-methyl-2-oxoglutarate aldolase